MKDCGEIKHIMVKINKLFVGMRIPGGYNRYVSVYETPLYNYVLSVLGKHDKKSLAIDDYRKYRAMFWHPTGEEQFKKLIKSILDEGYNAQDYPILVCRSISRIWPIGRWDVIDGFHRLSVLAAIGTKKIEVCTCRNTKRSSLRQILDKGLYAL